MPHAAHYILGPWCRFHLATYVGGYIVSTVGECVPDEPTRDRLARAKGVPAGAGVAEWLETHGYMSLAVDGRIYETMTFPAKRGAYACCPWAMKTLRELDLHGYTTAPAAYRGHLDLCQEWSKKPRRAPRRNP